MLVDYLLDSELFKFLFVLIFCGMALFVLYKLLKEYVMSNKEKNLNVRLSDEEFDLISRVSAEMGFNTLSQFVRNLLSVFVESYIKDHADK